MKQQRREPIKIAKNQPSIQITNKIINQVSAPEGEKKSKSAMGVIIALAGVMIALLTFLFGDTILPRWFGNGGGQTAESPVVAGSAGAPSPRQSNSVQSSSSPLMAEDGAATVKSGQTIQIYTNGDKDIKIYHKSINGAVADYTTIEKRGSQKGKIFRNRDMNPQGGYFSISKWEYLVVTVAKGEMVFSAEGDAVIRTQDSPLVVSREIHAGETYETTVIGKGSAWLTIKAIDEDTKGEYTVSPKNNLAKDRKPIELFSGDSCSEMLYSGDQIVFTLTSGAVEIYGDYTHFAFP